jgi:flagellar hook assembly protein FlgD
MHGPHPNPFNPATTLRFALPRAEAVTLAIYGLDGRRVRTLIQGTRPAGQHAVRWDGRDRSGRPVAAGTYLYELRAGPWQATGKLGLVK